MHRSLYSCTSESLIGLLLAHIHWFTHWVIVYCSREQPKQETELDSSTRHTSPSSTSDNIGPSQPDVVVYGEVQRAPSVNDLRGNDLYANVPSKNQYEDPGTVIYSELLFQRYCFNRPHHVNSSAHGREPIWPLSGKPFQQISAC